MNLTSDSKYLKTKSKSLTLVERSLFSRVVPSGIPILRKYLPKTAGQIRKLVGRKKGGKADGGVAAKGSVKQPWPDNNSILGTPEKAILQLLKGTAAPWFNQPSMGTQYFFDRSIQSPVDEGFLKVRK